MKKSITEARLCFVKDGFAYFSHKNPKRIVGDDWDDAPWEHNADEPYEYDCKIGFDGGGWHKSLSTYNNCAMDFAKKKLPWLVGPGGATIESGISLDEFLFRIESTGGSIYMTKALWRELY